MNNKMKRIAQINKTYYLKATNKKINSKIRTKKTNQKMVYKTQKKNNSDFSSFFSFENYP